MLPATFRDGLVGLEIKTVYLHSSPTLLKGTISPVSIASVLVLGSCLHGVCRCDLPGLHPAGTLCPSRSLFAYAELPPTYVL